MTSASNKHPEPGDVWVFGYGSLIWKVDFPVAERQPAWLDGWARRFWQGSHDHRGTPDAPGRVVTLVPQPGQRIRGTAYRVAAAVAEEVFAHLDHREQNGYSTHRVELALPARQVSGLVYIGTADNPAYLGPDGLQAMARQIHVSHGPSGSNREYLERLATALADLGAPDPHVDDLLAAVQALDAPGQPMSSPGG